MPAIKWADVHIETPQSLRIKAKSISVSRLYSCGYFITELFGSQAWVVDKNTYESQVLQLVGYVPKKISRWMREYNNKQYKRFCKLRHDDI